MGIRFRTATLGHPNVPQSLPLRMLPCSKGARGHVTNAAHRSGAPPLHIGTLPLRTGTHYRPTTSISPDVPALQPYCTRPWSTGTRYLSTTSEYPDAHLAPR